LYGRTRPWTAKTNFEEPPDRFRRVEQTTGLVCSLDGAVVLVHVGVERLGGGRDVDGCERAQRLCQPPVGAIEERLQVTKRVPVPRRLVFETSRGA